MALEAIGLPGTMAEAIEAVNFAGRVGYVGYCKKPLEVNATLIVKKELTIVGSRNSTIEEFRQVQENIATGRLDFKRLISAAYAPEDAGKAFAEWDAAPGRFVKIQVCFD